VRVTNEVEPSHATGSMKLAKGSGLMWVDTKATVMDVDKHDDY